MENVVKEENKKKNVIIGVLVCVIVLLVAALVYFVFIKKDESQQPVKPQDNSQVSYSKIDETKGSYYVVEGRTYNIYSSSYESNKKTLEEGKIVLSYPVININTNSVLSINAKIKETFNSIENGFTNKQDDGCSCVKYNDAYHCDEHIEDPSFKFYEDDKFITVVIRNNILSYCASGYSEDTIYTISKEDGKELTNNDIINYFGYSRDTINRELPKYIQSLFETDVSDELEGILDRLVFAINNGKLIIGYDVIDSTQYCSYNGTSFKEENSFGVFDS